jgi:outer membrane protein assembly factor BamB
VIGAFTTVCRALALCLGIGLCVNVEETPPVQGGGATPAVQKAETSSDPVWQRTLDSRPVSIVAGSAHLFVAGHGPGIEALSVADGASAWVLPVEDPVQLLVADGVLLAIERARLQVIDQASGAVRWGLDLPLPGSIATGYGDRVTIATGPYVWHGTADEGRKIWALEFPAPVSFIVSGAEGIVIVLTNNAVFLVDREGGQARWEVGVPAEVQAVTLAGGRIYLTGSDNALYCYRASDGQDSWHFPLPARVAGRPVVDSQQVYVALLDNTLHAFNRSSGNRQWWHPLSGRPADGPMLVGQDVYVPLTDGAISRSLTDGSGPRARMPARPTVAQDLVRLEAGGVLPGGRTVFIVTMGAGTDVRQLAVWPRS